MLTRLIAVALLVVSLVALWRAVAGAGYLFRIRVVGGFPLLRGRIPGRSRNEILDFVRELGLPEGAMITGLAEGDRFRLELGRAVPEELHQRIRNFFALR